MAGGQGMGTLPPFPGTELPFPSGIGGPGGGGGGGGGGGATGSPMLSMLHELAAANPMEAGQTQVLGPPLDETEPPPPPVTVQPTTPATMALPTYVELRYTP